MDLLTDSLRAALRANAEAACHPGHDPVPVVKFFNPCGAATWLATELDPDGDTLFGLADLGFGCPELGSFSLTEIASLRLPFGLRIERDLYFASGAPLSKWAEAARQAGSILSAEQQLRSGDMPPPDEASDEILPSYALTQGADPSSSAAAAPPDGGGAASELPDPGTGSP